MKPPRVFISYSHDSAQHKEWVLSFATTLRQRGVDAVLDQWDLKPGSDLPHFMETELASSDFALMICSERYVEKANAGQGGVGYEKMIMTSSLLKTIDSSKVIPIIRENPQKFVPTFMGSKLYIDFSNDKDIEYSLDELLRTLLNSPLFEKPEIGSNPFKPLEQSKPDRVSDGLKETMKVVSDAFNSTPNQQVTIKDLMQYSSMHRLTLERYLNVAIKEGVLARDIIARYTITVKGIEYLIEHGIIEA
ncbi:toll/interleukin-1 receptor domain-containing protein [Azotobacter beijerinckii]|uniref:SEFIR domain-containing protein n=1 Tax=Azotobacter beijerinckii TaxID=170623 RepID=A0A1I4CCG2_9GAMM|nr:toll/interleukin-1 receptor domain-containing protein [Azotobacter beijerinckii]SFB23104.1 SEFIR domain-containing protein [Azotobacter beijerinckii]SFK78874.1 SEFIR domain-containing protein [Azotobacter beijerinckii]